MVRLCPEAVERGLEIAGLAVVDVVNHTAFHYYATAGRPRQTLLSEGTTLLAYYAQLLTSQATQLGKLSKYVAVDAYFAKYSFVEALTGSWLEVITRLRNDAVLWYPYLGPKRVGRGRQKKYAGRVAIKEPDLQYFRPCIKETDWQAFEACLYCKSLKRLLKVVLVHHYRSDGSLKSHQLFASTDVSLSGADLWYYYHLRFQRGRPAIEFIYRDGKQFLGLTHCQSRQQNRLHFHFNFSLTLLSLAKLAHWLIKPVAERGSFSVQDIKTTYFNHHMLETFIKGFGLCPTTAKNNPVYHKLAEYAKIAA